MIFFIDPVRQDDVLLTSLKMIIGAVQRCWNDLSGWLTSVSLESWLTIVLPLLILLYIIEWNYWYCFVENAKNSAAPEEVADQSASFSRQHHHRRILSPHQVYAQVRSQLSKNSVVGRQSTRSCHELWQLERSNRNQTAQLTAVPLTLRDGSHCRCYACGTLVDRVHAIYVLCCQRCGVQFNTMRSLSRNLGGKVALVIGGRTKLGHQVALKLLEAGAFVIVTTRFVDSAFELFQKYPHSPSFIDRLLVMMLDLKAVANDTSFSSNADDSNASSDSDDQSDRDEQQRATNKKSLFLDEIYETIANNRTIGKGQLDILVNCAAQTIAVRESQSVAERAATRSKNRYGDALFVDSKHSNSWALHYEEVSDRELRDVIDINAIAIDVVIKRMLPLMKRATGASPYIVNVHAREGLQQVSKSAAHYHTNMAKAALHMLTRMLIEQNLRTNDGLHLFRVHGVCPGWFSVDEYYEKGAPLPFAPLDEIDAASRVCYPIFAQLPSERRTRRHFTRFAT